MNYHPDFQSAWLQTMIYELVHYSQLTKVFEKRGHHIHMYEYKTYHGKHTKLHTLKYNTMTSSYEINSSRYPCYRNALNIMWNLDKHSPL
jgi:hypothetical protein